MVKVSVEMRKGAVRRRVSITAPSLQRALELAGGGILSYQILCRSDEEMEAARQKAA